jgi:PAP2 superfamily
MLLNHALSRRQLLFGTAAAIALPTRANIAQPPLTWPDAALFSKSLQHNAQGLLSTETAAQFKSALRSRDWLAWEVMPVANEIRLVNPLAAHAWAEEPLAKSVSLPPPPPLVGSDELAAEALQLYWMAQLRDVNLAFAERDSLWQQATAELSQRSSKGVTPQNLFQLGLQGEGVGHRLSQFLYQPIAYGSQLTHQTYKIPFEEQAFNTDVTEWLRIQNGHWPSLPQGISRFDSKPHYLRSGRDLAEYVRSDFAYQPYINASAILHNETHRPREALSKTHPYKTARSQNGFVQWGSADVYRLIGRATDLALKAAWACKWQHFPLLRPEEYGGHLHFKRELPSWLRESQAVQRTLKQFGTALLSQAYPEAAPAHPAYVSGHAAIAGACVTVLKALFDGDRVFRFPQVPTRDGLDTRHDDTPNLTYSGELNKLAANIAVGRQWAGIHWRCDSLEGLKLGERIGHALLQETVKQSIEKPSLRYTDLFGQLKTITP